MEKIKVKVTPSEERGIFHDSRKDVRLLSKVVNHLIEKVNELIERVSELEKTQHFPTHHQ